MGSRTTLPQQMTTEQLRDMISSGSTRESLPTVTNGRSVISTRDSASKTHQAQLDKIARTKSFQAKYEGKKASDFGIGKPVKYDNIREQIRQREELIKSGVKGTSFDARYDTEIDYSKAFIPTAKSNVDTYIPIQQSTNYSGLGNGTEYIKKTQIPQATPNHNKNNQEITVDSLNKRPQSIGQLNIERNMLVAGLVGGIIIYLGVLKK